METEGFGWSSKGKRNCIRSTQSKKKVNGKDDTKAI